MQYRQFRLEDLPQNISRPDVDLVFGANGALGGIMICDMEEYGPFGIHDDQEGFLILEGNGSFWCDDEEIKVSPDMAILIPPHVRHCFKKDTGTPDMKIFYFHAM